MMDLYIKLSVCVPRLISGRGFYAQISSEITSEFPGVTRGTLEGDVSRLQAIPKLETDTSRHLFRFHLAQLIVKTEEIKKGLNPNVGLTKIGENTEECDRIGVQVEQRKTV